MADITSTNVEPGVNVQAITLSPREREKIYDFLGAGSPPSDQGGATPFMRA